MSDTPEIHCPDCNNRLSQDLTRVLLSGTSVYCERCGFKFTGIEKGEVKEFVAEKSYPGDANQNKYEAQWKLWKKKWHEIKKKYFEPVFNGSYPPQSTVNPQVNFSNNPLSSQQFDNTVERERREAKENMDRIYPTLHALNRLSLLISFIIIFASFITFIVDAVNRNTALWMDLVILFYQIYVINLDLHKYIPEIDKKRLSNAGIGLILIGIISSSANGIGGFLILRGALYLMYTLALLRYSYPNLLKQGSKENTYFWTREIIKIYVSMLGPLLFFNYVLALVSAIYEMTIFGNDDMIPLLVMGVIGILIFNGGALKQIQKSNLTKIDDGWIIGCFILGGITMGLYGLGMLLIFLAVLLIICKEALGHFAGSIPTLDELSLLPQLTSENHPSQTSISPLFNPVVQEQLISPPSPVTDFPAGTNIRYRRFNPETGLPYPVPIAEKISVAIPMVQTSFPQNIPSVSTAQIQLASPVEPTKIFTVLDPDVRNRLMQLPITEKDREELSKTLLFLAKKEQLRYLIEIEGVNQDHPKEMQQNIQRINRLTLSEKEKQSLIAQLEYLPLDKQAEFVQFVENSLKN